MADGIASSIFSEKAAPTKSLPKQHVAEDLSPEPLATTTPTSKSAEKALLWKLDRHVLPTISLLYMLAFIDRINIGNARIQGLEADLRMGGNDYNVALQIFFVPYIFLEVPSNVVLKKVAPSTWLSGIMFFWGKYIYTA